jgi:hypothetical protein
MEAEERAAWETMKALREVRNTHRLGSKEWEQADHKYKKAEAEYYLRSKT